MSDNNWIPVRLRVPEGTEDNNEGCMVSRRVLVYSEYEGGILFGYRCDWYDPDDNNHGWAKDASGMEMCIDVTHWMELPDAPNQLEES